MIHANCRMRLTADDFMFVVRVLSRSEADHVSLVKFLTTKIRGTRSLITKCSAKAILEFPQRQPISPHLLFYVLCRKVLRDTHGEEPGSGGLCRVGARRFHEDGANEAFGGNRQGSTQYLSDIMNAMNNAGTREAFYFVRMRQTMLCSSAESLRTIWRCARVNAGRLIVVLRSCGPDELPGCSDIGKPKIQASTIYEELATAFGRFVLR